MGDILAKHPFKNYKIKQEYPVVKVNPDFHNSRCCFDWVIIDLKVAIEVNGAQHYKKTSWSADTTDEQATANLERRQDLDAQKEIAAKDAGWIFIAIDYKDIKHLNANKLLKIIKEEQEKLREIRKEIQDTGKPKVAKKDPHIKQKQYRKEIYRKAKERYKSFKSNASHDY